MAPIKFIHNKLPVIEIHRMAPFNHQLYMRSLHVEIKKSENFFTPHLQIRTNRATLSDTTIFR